MSSLQIVEQNVSLTAKRVDPFGFFQWGIKLLALTRRIASPKENVKGISRVMVITERFSLNACFRKYSLLLLWES